jgi:hypothetical protein
MRQLARVSMTMQDLDRLKSIQAVVDGALKPKRAAERLGMTSRQVRRLVALYRDHGPVGLISRRRDRRSNRRLSAALEAQIIQILREHYADFGPTLAAEKLQMRHDIRVAKETVRRLQIGAGLWIPRKLRPPKVQQPRARRACVGELIQIDGCEHRWFEDRAPMCTVLVYVDDATSRLMIVHFTGSESTFGYFEATREYLGRYGKPLALYSDKASIFRVNNPQAIKGPGYTQFGRALFELNIDGICANTPAAKGRIWALDFMADALYGGRAFRTLNVIDEGNRQVLGIEVATSIPSLRVIRVMEQLIELHGKPQALRMDNGSELTSIAFTEWCEQRGIEPRFIQPGKPDQNAFIERFNKTYRDEVLDAYVFESVEQVREITDIWLHEYNEERPHDSLGRVPPLTFMPRPIARESSYKLCP